MACCAQALHRGFAGRIVGQVRDGHATGAEGHGCCDLGQFVGSGRDLERPAADVEQQDLPGGPAEPAPHGEEREASLGLAAEHLQRLAERRFDAGDHRGAVRRLAHGGGRRREELVHALLGRGAACSRDRRFERLHAILGDRAVRPR